MTLDWLDRSYIIDWLVATALWFLSDVVNIWPIYQRSFSIDDPLIAHEHTKQQISGTLNGSIAFFIPLAVCAVSGSLSRSLPEIHHGFLALWSARALNRLITEFLKNRIGRLRPDFLARCDWDDVLETCTGNLGNIADGRKSFPSGHSSTAFAGMTFLSFFLAGKTAAWCFGASLPPSSLRSSRLVRLVLTLLPLVWATWVAISRVEDYRHHKEDVIVGSLIGIISSTTCYLIFFPSPFSLRNYTAGLAGQPRMLYMENNNDNRSRNGGFELTGLHDDEIEPV